MPLGAELHTMTLKVSQVSGNEPSSSKALTSSSNVIPIEDSWFIMPWIHSHDLQLECPLCTSNASISWSRTSCLVPSLRAYNSSNFYHKVRACVSSMIWFKTLSLTHCRMNPQACRWSTSYWFSFISSGITLKNTCFQSSFYIILLFQAWSFIPFNDIIMLVFTSIFHTSKCT